MNRNTLASIEQKDHCCFRNQACTESQWSAEELDYNWKGLQVKSLLYPEAPWVILNQSYFLSLTNFIRRLKGYNSWGGWCLCFLIDISRLENSWWFGSEIWGGWDWRKGKVSMEYNTIHSILQSKSFSLGEMIFIVWRSTVIPEDLQTLAGTCQSNILSEFLRRKVESNSTFTHTLTKT